MILTTEGLYIAPLISGFKDFSDTKGLIDL
jgi:hypothetical protein